jgi:hypothetical protein
MTDRFRLVVAFGLLATLTVPRALAGTIAEQRARLPPPATCVDPVAGVWKSHDWDPDRDQWTEFTLQVRRGEPGSDRLVGTIENHSWFGPETEVQPGPCVDQLHYVVSMDAEGALRGLEVSFGGVGQWRLDETRCGTFDAGYNLDVFTGVIDPKIQEFQSVNNDGGSAVNQPAVFRRVRCFEDPVVHDPVAPPPFMPPSAGCGCG